MDEEKIVATFFSSLRDKYCERWRSYETWVKENPEEIARAEGIFRSLAYASYMFTGTEVQQQLYPELAYAVSNLYVFLNDNILRKAYHLCRQTSFTEERLTKWLTIIEHIEVFLELAGTRIGGQFGRWIVIAAVHILRTIFRLILLFKYHSGIQPVPPLTTMKRDTALLKRSGITEGQRSGRVIRTLDAAPDINHRAWRLPETDQGSPGTPEHLERSQLSGPTLVGEVLHISRPLVHLACLSLFGRKSWKPWMAALGVDLGNLILLYGMDQRNKLEDKEVNRRWLLLILYLLRSPCFDNYSKARVDGFLGTTGRIWGLQTLSKSMKEYLPKWQQIYFYNWLQ